MFGKKKIYKITYVVIRTHSTLIVARNKFKALKKFHRTNHMRYDVLSIEEN